jgi:flagellar hook-associated protein 3 FlgL
MMRISTALAFDRAIDAMNDRQSRLVRTQEELSTGKRLLVASDDPMGVADAERTRSQLRRVELQQRMNDFARSILGQAEATMASVTDLMQTVRETMVQAGNGSLSPSDRALLATQVRGYRDELFGLANRSDAAGGYVFGGQGSPDAPFDATDPVGYQPAPGQQMVGLGNDTPTSLDGRATFMSVQTASGTRSVFEVLDDAIALLENRNATGAEVSDGVKAALDGVDNALEQVITKRTEIGEHLRAIDSRAQLAESGSIELQAHLSELQDLDFAKAISEFTMNQTAQQAAMRTYSEIARMSLFDYL